jgi:hypothetical protein
MFFGVDAGAAKAWEVTAIMIISISLIFLIFIGLAIADIVYPVFTASTRCPLGT